MLIDIDDYLLSTLDQNGKYNFTSKYGLILNIKDQVSFGSYVSALLDCHRQTAIRQPPIFPCFWGKKRKLTTVILKFLDL